MSAVTLNEYDGNGSKTTYSFTFPYLKTSDIKASLDGVVTTAFTLPNATTLQFNTAPSNGVKIKIYRETGIDDLTATFYPGSAIKSEDLNDNFTQNLFVTQEVNQRYISSFDVFTTTSGGTVVHTGNVGTVTSAMLANGTIVDADISGTAEIAVSKLANGSARQLLQTAANGTDVEFTSNVDVPGTLDVTGNTDLDGTLNVDGATTLSAVNVSGTSTLATVNVSGTSTLAAVNVSGLLDANGGATIDDIQIGVTANNEIDTSSGNLTIDSAGGTTTVDDDLIVTGNLTANGTTLHVNNAVVNTHLDVNGHLTADNIHINANEIDTTSGNLTLDSIGGTTTVDDNLVVTGNLTVTGTNNATTLNSLDSGSFLRANASDTSTASIYTFNGPNIGSTSNTAKLEGKDLLIRFGVGSTNNIPSTMEISSVRGGITDGDNVPSSLNRINLGHGNLGLPGGTTTELNSTTLGHVTEIQAGRLYMMLQDKDNSGQSNVIMRASDPDGMMFYHPDTNTGISHIYQSDKSGIGTNDYGQNIILARNHADARIISNGIFAKSKIEIGSGSASNVLTATHPLSIYHDSNVNYIKIQSGPLHFLSNSSGAVAAKVVAGGGFELWHTTKKFESASTGTNTTGTSQTTSATNTATFLAAGEIDNPDYPAYGFAGQNADNGSRGAGMYLPSDNVLAFATAGNEELRIQNGGGISFNGDTATANALNDYEEGAWTPALNGTHSNMGTGAGRYVKIGNVVHYWIEFGGLSAPNLGSFSANTYITGFPIATPSSAQPNHWTGTLSSYSNVGAMTVLTNYYNSADQWYITQAASSLAYLWGQITVWI